MRKPLHIFCITIEGSYISIRRTSITLRDFTVEIDCKDTHYFPFGKELFSHVTKKAYFCSYY